jgi:hypothetical protein
MPTNFRILALSAPSNMLANAGQAADIHFMNAVPFTLFSRIFYCRLS